MPAAPADRPMHIRAASSANPRGQTDRELLHQLRSPNLPEARFCANCGSKLPEKVA